MRRHPARHAVTAGLLAFGAITGCSSAPDGGPVFENEGAAEVTCLAHQSDEPGPRYTDRQMRSTAEVLALMKYYTAHGTKPFCDDAPANATDKAWVQVYLDLGGTTEKVPSILP